ncbi:MAG: phosphatase PAP2 family protein [Phycisphaerales bacterium]
MIDSPALVAAPSRPAEINASERPPLTLEPRRMRLLAHPVAWLCGFIIACGWDRAVWLFVSARTRPTIKGWEESGPWSSVWSTLYHAVKLCGTVWVPAAIGAIVVLRSFVQPDTARVRRAVRVGTLIFLCPAAAGLAAEGLKLVFRRRRPEFADGWYAFRFDDFWSTSGFGLPSSHAAPAVAFAVALAVVWPRHRARFGMLAGLCCVSRVLAGAHYLSDAVLGVVVGLVVGRAVVWLDMRNNRFVPVSAAS